MIGLSPCTSSRRSTASGTCAPELLPQQYFDGVTGSGGVAVLLPPQPRVDAAAGGGAPTGLDGPLILTGGLDIDPERYGAERHPLTNPPREDRDAWEFALLRGAEERGMPVFGICRGLQVINVAHGGTLHQHLPDALGTERYRIETPSSRRTPRWWMPVPASPGSSARARSKCTAITTRASTASARGSSRPHAQTTSSCMHSRRRASSTSSPCSGIRSRTRRTGGCSRRSSPRHPCMRIHAARTRPRSPGGGRRVSFTVINPATATPLQEVSRASVAEVDEAVGGPDAARWWKPLPPATVARAGRRELFGGRSRRRKRTGGAPAGSPNSGIDTIGNGARPV